MKAARPNGPLQRGFGKLGVFSQIVYIGPMRAHYIDVWGEVNRPHYREKAIPVMDISGTKSEGSWL
jgi:hypothetical protein